MAKGPYCRLRVGYGGGRVAAADTQVQTTHAPRSCEKFHRSFLRSPWNFLICSSTRRGRGISVFLTDMDRVLPKARPLTHRLLFFGLRMYRSQSYTRSIDHGASPKAVALQLCADRYAKTTEHLFVHKRKLVLKTRRL